MNQDKDLGPLNWVKGEIDQALLRAQDAITNAGGGSPDAERASQLQFAQNHLHQVRGALAIVGLDGLAHFIDGFDQALGRWARGEIAFDAAAAALCRRTLASIGNYLDELAHGAPDQPLRLLPLHQALGAHRGEAVSGADLFFPDLERRPPRRPPPAPLPADQLAARIKALRTRFQRGLLGWLKQGETAAAAEMREAIAGIEAMQSTPAQRSFWWVALAFLDALARGQFNPRDAETKRLVTRIDTQLRHIADPAPPPERVLRELLYALAQQPAQGELQQAVHALYELAALIPDEAPLSDTPLAPLLRELRERLAKARDHWTLFCEGSAVALQDFDRHLQQLINATPPLARPAIDRLLVALGGFCAWLRKDPLKLSDTIAMEVATSLLLLDGLLGPTRQASQDEQVREAIERLEALMQGRPPSTAAPSAAVEAAQRAQEREALEQLRHEILSNLAQIEQVLDSFFRHPERRSELGTLETPLTQVDGALQMLGEARALEELRAARSDIAALIRQPGEPPRELCEQIANRLSALSLFIESAQAGGISLDRLLGREPEAHATETPAEPQAAPAPLPPAAPAPAPFKPVIITAPPSPAEPPEIDAELLGIFIEEAHEVLSTISTQLARTRANPADREAFTALRRGFHTLKGSGRMVGLQALGETAWGLEQTLNRWLQLEWQPTPALLSLIDSAHALFSDWVERLEQDSKASADSSALLAAAECLRNVETPHDQDEQAACLAPLQPPAAVPASPPAMMPAEPAPAEPITTAETTLQTQPAALEAQQTPPAAADELDFAAFESAAQAIRPAVPAEPAAPDLAAFEAETFELEAFEPEPTEPEPSEQIEPQTAAESMSQAEPESFADSFDLAALELEPSQPSVSTAEPPADQAPQDDFTALLKREFGSEASTETSATPSFDFELDQDLNFALEEETLGEPFAEPTLPAPSGLADGEFEFPSLDLSPEGEVLPVAPSEQAAPPSQTTEQPVEPEAPAFDFSQIDLSLQAPALETVGPEPSTAEPSPEPQQRSDQSASPSPLEPPTEFRQRISEALQDISLELPAEEELSALGLGAASTLDEFAAEPSDALSEIDLEALLEEEPPAAPSPEQALTDVLSDALSQAQAADQAPATEEELAALSPLNFGDLREEQAVALTEELAEEELAELTPAELLPDQARSAAQPSPAALAAELADETDQIESLELEEVASQDQAAEAIAPTPPAEPPLEPVAEADMVMLGDVALSRPLYELYLGEAMQHLATLREELARLRANPTLLPSERVVRAAHTLAGISGTARIVAVQTLAKSLEHALERAQHQSMPPNAEQGELLQRCAERLQAMVAEIAARQLPLPSPELIDQLDGIGHLLEPSPPVAADYLQPGDETAARQAAEIDAEIQAELRDELASEAAQSSPAAESFGEQALVQDDIDEQLLPIFLEESADMLAQIGEALRAWRGDADNPARATAVARLLHTLKGSARMAGAMSLGEQVHGLESALERALENGLAPAQIIDELEIGIDQTGQAIAALGGGEPIAAPARPAVPETGGEAAEAAAGSLRVRAELIDRLVNEAGEIGIARTRIDGELRTVRRSLLDLTENVIRLRNQLRELEIQAEVQMRARVGNVDTREDFDPLELDRYTRLQELTRLLAESVGDVTTVQQNLLRNLDGAEAALNAQGRLTRDLHQALMSVRMVPLSSLADRLYRVVRQTAKDLGKRANLEIRGGQIEIDRSVLERITAPLEHLLRNAIAHGIEAPAARLAAGKPESGEIVLKASQQGNEIVLELCDDGAGLDYARIAERARTAGLLAADETPDPRRLANLIFVPGFSTAQSLSAVSGRGIGMDVVKSETAALGGRVDIDSTPGQGASFRIHLPLTLAVTQALLVKAGKQTFAIPASLVTQVQELKQEALEAVRSAGELEWQGQRFPYRYLPALLGEPGATPEPQRYSWLLLLRAGNDSLALHVDGLRGNQEIVVKNVGQQLARVVGISGATVLGDGEIVPILNPVALAGRALPTAAAQTPPPATVAEAAHPTVMVVDDSLTVRKITGRLLEREGYKVMTAKDGVDAIEQLIDRVPDVILSDIEMPRMDGFDLLRNLRADPRLAQVPVVMISSRTADKHREHARNLGATAYLGKPYQEDELLALLRGYTAQPA